MQPNQTHHATQYNFRELQCKRESSSVTSQQYTCMIHKDISHEYISPFPIPNLSRPSNFPHSTLSPAIFSLHIPITIKIDNAMLCYATQHPFLHRLVSLSTTTTKRKPRAMNKHIQRKIQTTNNWKTHMENVIPPEITPAHTKPNSTTQLGAQLGRDEWKGPMTIK